MSDTRTDTGARRRRRCRAGAAALVITGIVVLGSIPYVPRAESETLRLVIWLLMRLGGFAAFLGAGALLLRAKRSR